MVIPQPSFIHVRSSTLDRGRRGSGDRLGHLGDAVESATDVEGSTAARGPRALAATQVAVEQAARDGARQRSGVAGFDADPDAAIDGLRQAGDVADDNRATHGERLEQGE